MAAGPDDITAPIEVGAILQLVTQLQRVAVALERIADWWCPLCEPDAPVEREHEQSAGHESG